MLKHQTVTRDAFFVPETTSIVYPDKLSEIHSLHKYKVKETLYDETYLPCVKTRTDESCKIYSLTTSMEACYAIKNDIPCRGRGSSSTSDNKYVPELSIPYLNERCPLLPPNSPDTHALYKWAKDVGVPPQEQFIQKNVTNYWKIEDYGFYGISNGSPDTKPLDMGLYNAFFNHGPFVAFFRQHSDYDLINQNPGHVYHALAPVNPSGVIDIRLHSVSVVGVGEFLDDANILNRYWIYQDDKGLNFAERGYGRLMEHAIEYAVSIKGVNIGGSYSRLI